MTEHCKCLVNWGGFWYNTRAIAESFFDFNSKVGSKYLRVKGYSVGDSKNFMEGGVISPKSYVNVPAGHQKSDFLYTVPFFLLNFPPIIITIFDKKHSILPQLDAFYCNLLQIFQIYKFRILHL